MQTGFKVDGVHDRRLCLCIHKDVACPYMIDGKYCTVRPYCGDTLRVAESCMLEEELLKGKRRLTLEEYTFILDMVPWRWLTEYMARRKVKVDECLGKGVK